MEMKMNEFKVSGTVNAIGGSYMNCFEGIIYLTISDTPSNRCCLIIGVKKGVSIKNIKIGDKVVVTGMFKYNGLLATEIRK